MVQGSSAVASFWILAVQFFHTIIEEILFSIAYPSPHWCRLIDDINKSLFMDSILLMYVLVLCQYHTVLITTSLEYSLRSGCVWYLQICFSPSRLVCLFGVCDSTQILGLFILTLLKKCYWYFDMDYIECLNSFK